MFLEQISLKQYRNYTDQELCFAEKINIFTGSNAQGKTNLLEAIYYLAVSRSFRTIAEQEMVKWDSEFFFLKGALIKENGSRSHIEIGFQQPKRFQIKLNGVPARRAEYIHRHPVVVFSPDDLLLIKEGPARRRRFLNLEGSRLNPTYYRTLKDYHRVLQQRNRMLKEARSRPYSMEMFEPWDRALVVLGSTIINQRILLLRELAGQARRFYGELTASTETISLDYVSSVVHAGELEMTEQLFSEQLGKNRSLELKRGYTLIGPHLDDFMVSINGHEAKKYASQGQQRTAVLAIKMGETELFYRSRCENPVVLLDDVFSEFDRERRVQLMHFLRQREGQSFITSAVPFAQVVPGVSCRCQIFSVDKGKISVEGTENGS